MIQEELDKLEARIFEMSESMRRLEEQNRILRVDQRSLNKENGRLTEKNRIACTRLESIVGRLKSLEQTV
ncbi:MAG: TIGR02449 family protein [Gammaproteobacteria bacterium]|nr:TIGR02449 family protein [Gammaproteobacteria bacterium]